MISPAGPQMNCSRRGHRQPGIRLTGVRRAPYSIRTPSVKALSTMRDNRRPTGMRLTHAQEGERRGVVRPGRLVPLDASGRLGQGLRLQGLCAPRSTACQAPAPTRPSAGSRRPGRSSILVEPQLGENIGAAARAMANFGLSQLRLVKPRQLAQRQGADDGGRRRPRPRRRRAFRHARSRHRRLQLRPCHHRARSRPGQAASSARPTPRPRRRRASAPARPSPSCSAASATGSKTTRWRWPTASSLCRSIRPSPRSIWRRRW